MTHEPRKPVVTPDGKPVRPRRDTDQSERSDVGQVEDPGIAGDAGRPGYGNTDEAKPDEDGLVRGGDRERPLI